MWNFISADKAQLALSPETKFHIKPYPESAILAEI
jgi:hypothetical protein